MKKVLAIAALMGVAGSATVADAAPVSATLVSVTSYSPNGSAPWNGTADTSTWTFDTATGVAAMTGGSYSRLTKAGATPLMRHNMTGVTLGNFAPTGTTWNCIEGTFGGGGSNTGGVGASICGNYNFGVNLTNESTYTPSVTGSSVVTGGDDGVIGPSQSLVTSYSSMLKTALATPGQFCLSNSDALSAADRCTTAGTTATAGYDFVFQIAPADTVPDPFSFTDQTNVALSTLTTSDAITVAGIDAASPISVVGGEYAIGAGAFTAVPGTVTVGQTVTVRQTSSATPGTATDATLTIGGVADTFTVTTEAADTTPDAFNFTPLTDVAVSTPIISNAITVAGINAPAAISVSAGGEYAIGAGPFTADPGTVSLGQTVTVRQTSSASFVTSTDATVTIGGVADTFTVTTVAAGTTPDPFSFTDQTNVPLSTLTTSDAITVAGINVAAPISVVGGDYAINGGAFTAVAGTVTVGQTVTVRQTSSATPATATDATVTIGGVPGTFTVTTVAADTSPDAFSFTPLTGITLSTPITSNAITVAGINVAAPISVVGGDYAINGGAFTAVSGTVTVGQTVTVRQTSSATPATATNATVTIGGVPGTFTVTTVAADTTPDAFSFTPLTGVTLSTPITSNAITVAGINSPAGISVSAGGEYAINGGTFTAVSGNVSNGNTVTVRQTSSATPATATSATLTIGGVFSAFTVTTVAAGTTPDAFSFTDQTDVPLSTSITSDAITVAGINAPAAIAVVGGEYAINGGAFTAVAGTVSVGDTVTVRQTSSASFVTFTDATVTIGGVADTFTVTTVPVPVSTPDPFTFTDLVGVPAETVQISNAVTITGINVPATIRVAGGEYSIGCDSDTFTTAAGTINNGETVCVRQTSAFSSSGISRTTLTIGATSTSFGVSDTFTTVVASGGGGAVDGFSLFALGLMGWLRRKVRS